MNESLEYVCGIVDRVMGVGFRRIPQQPWKFRPGTGTDKTTSTYLENLTRDTMSNAT